MKMGMGFPIPNLSNLPGPSRPGGGGTPAPPGPTPLAQIDNLNSMEFDGVANNKINCGLSNTYNILSLSAWVKPNNPVNYAGIFGTRNGIGPLNYLLTIDNTNKFRFIINDGSNKAVLSNDQITSNWTHVVGVADGNNTHLYINGVKQTATQAYGTIATTNDSLMIGAQSALDTAFTTTTKQQI